VPLSSFRHPKIKYFFQKRGVKIENVTATSTFFTSSHHMPPRKYRRYATKKAGKAYYRKQLTAFGGPSTRTPKAWAGRNTEIHRFVYCAAPLEMFSGTVEDNQIGGPYANRCASPITFALNSLPTTPLTNLTSNYSWYRIVKADIWFQANSSVSPIINATEPTGGANVPYNAPTVHYDFNNVYNGFTLSSGWNYQPELAQSSSYGNFDPVRGPLPRFRVYPKAEMVSSNPNPPSALAAMGRGLAAKGQWFSCSNPGLVHLAMRIAIDPVVTTPSTPSLAQPFKLFVYTRYYIEVMGATSS